MAYEKNTWKTGDVITSTKLNHMEDGIADGILVIGGFSYTDGLVIGTSDKTWQEINAALAAVKRCVIILGSNIDGYFQRIITSAGVDDGIYYISGDAGFNAETSSADGYPTTDGSVG